MPAVRCSACNLSPPPFDAARSLAVYEGRLRRAISGLKFRGRKAAAGVLGGLLAAMTPLEITRGVGVVVPVPLHPSRLRARGFNQSELLARPVALMLGVPCAARALRRVHQDRPQVELRACARVGNVRNAFAPGEGTVAGTVLLVDDVFSTGSTAAACALALQDAGADRVVVLTLARAVRRSGTATPTGPRR
ncbi:MAG: ComF family protein [bacterium]|nr:ComF family protein [bacterium]